VRFSGHLAVFLLYVVARVRRLFLYRTRVIWLFLPEFLLEESFMMNQILKVALWTSLLSGCVCTPTMAQLPTVMVQLPYQLLQLKPDDPEFTKVASGQIDKYVIAELKRKQLRPPGMSSDEQFLRRTYLNIAGRIPTYEEAKAFLADEDEGKRLKLVSDLIDSDGYVMSMFHFWADILRAKDDFGNGINGRAYQKWIRDSIEKNMPYDKMVHELVTAQGGMWEPGNGAVGYYVRDRGMPLDNMANTTRIFLGTQIACAQCHDHPHDKWSQMEFYQMAAFTHNLSNLSSQRRYPSMDSPEARENPQARRLRDIDRWVKYEFLDTYIVGDGAGRIKLPPDYKYKDGKPNEWIGARTMMGKSLRHLKEDKDMKESRNRLADWMISSENPNFTSVISNRLWKRVMGVGLVEPLDNFKKGTTASNPQLLAYLDKLMLHLKYDMKAFNKILYSSKAYQLATNPEQVDTRRPYYYQGYPLQRLSAEQIWDSLLAITIDQPDDAKSGRFTDAVMWRGRPVLGNKTMSQMQKEVVAVQPENYPQYIRDLAKEMDKGYGGDMMMMGRRGRGGDALMRASELPSPTPPSHFLRKFGQSDREVIENSSKEGDVTQVLTLLNGHLEKHVTGNLNSVIMNKVRSASTPEEKVNVVFLSILTRMPTDSEMEFMKEEAERGDDGAKNMIAALVNTSEFMHMH